MDKIFKVTLFFLLLTASCGYVAQNAQETVDTIEKPSPFVEKYKVPEKKAPPLIIRPALKKISPLDNKFFTFSADKAPLKTVLYAVAKDAGMNLAVDPDVDTDVTITANFNNTPIKTALEVITDLAGVYYEIKGNVIYIKATKTKVFHLPYVHTKSSYKVDLGGDVLGSSGTTGGTAGGTGGTTGAGGTLTVSPAVSNLKGDFSLKYENPEDINAYYQELEDALDSILGLKGAIPINKKPLNSYTLNRFAGVLIVTATKDKMKKVENLIKKLKKEVRKQVLIEAKIVEVTLDKEFRYGVDWNLLMRNFLNTGASVSVSQTLALGTSYGQIVVTGADFNSVLNALERTGKIETLSSPRIRVLNGQTALISSGVIVPFWEKQVSTVTGTATAQQVAYLRSNVLNGILLGVTPYIENKEIMMNIVPVSTKIEDIRQLVENDQVVAEAPVLNIKEAGTVIKVRDGDLVIIGGLIGTDRKKIVSKIPGLGDIPGIGVLFRKEEIIKQKKELIIFLRPHIIEVH
ncbi:secretin and TonB N-terminal domain-containing protein [Persephonella sp.]